MARNIAQVYATNPSTSMTATDLIYLGLSPFGITDDSAIEWSDMQSSITAVGTIASGIWNATAIATAYGGTGLTSPGASGNILTSNGTIWTSAAPAPGGVTSVSGTTNRITSTGGTTPVIDISAAYVGQASITTLGTIGAGVWNGTAVTVPFGGTGVTSATAYALMAGGTTSTGAHQSLTTGTLGQLLSSGGASALPTWTTSTFPTGAATINKMLRGDGTNWVETTATTLTSADVLSGLTQLNVDNMRLDGNQLLSTNTNGNIAITPDGSGISIIGSSTPFTTVGVSSTQIIRTGAASLLGNATYANIVAGSSLSAYKSRSTTIGVFTAVQAGDITHRLDGWGDDGTAFVLSSRIQQSVTGTVSTGVVPGAMVFQTANASGTLTTAMTISSSQTTVLANPLGVASGGTGVVSSAAFCLIAGGLTSTGAFQALPVGTLGQFLRSQGPGNLPQWSGASIPGTTVINQLLYSSANNVISGLATANSSSLTTSSTGVPTWSASMTNGQFIIGVTGGTPIPGNISAGPGIGIVNAAANVTISATGAASGGFTFNSVSGTSQTAVAGNAYVLNNAGATTVTMPTTGSSTLGDTIKIKGRSSAAFIVQANTGQIFTYGATQSTTAGTATSAAGTDSVQFVYVAANEWSIDWTVSAGFVLA